MGANVMTNKPTPPQLCVLQSLLAGATLSAERAMWHDGHFIGLKSYILRKDGIARTISIDSVIAMRSKGLIRTVNRQRVRRIKGERFVSGSRVCLLTAAARRLLKQSREASKLP